jgi:hypothetical protein
MAVEDIAAMPPSATPACQEPPNAATSPIVAATVSSTCVMPRPKTTRRIASSRVRLNSSPTENMRNTTPNPASCCVSCAFEASPSACGPSARPVTR